MSEPPPARAWREQLQERLRPLVQGGDGAPAALPSPWLLAALGGRLAAEVTAPEDVPALPVSAMDGFAVRCAAVDAAGGTVLPVVADLPAAPGGAGRLAPGAAARIMTGAPVPAGADAVIEVERTDADPHGPAPARVRIGPVPGLRPGRHVRAVGEEIARGAVLAPAGQQVGAGLVGLAAMLGVERLPVEAASPARPAARGPRVAVLVTGDEVLPGEGVRRGEASGAVRDSNGAMLAAALLERGARPLVRRSSDDAQDFRGALEEVVAAADLVVTTGGIGHGAFDVVKSVLGEAGEGTSRFAHLALRPGGPQGWGTRPAADGRTVPLVHLPGTPVGALVGFHLFVRPLLEEAPAPIGRAVLGPVREDARPRAGRRLHALPAVLEGGAPGTATVHLLPGRRLAPYAEADALVLLELAAGDEVRAGQEVGVIGLGPGAGTAR